MDGILIGVVFLMLFYDVYFIATGRWYYLDALLFRSGWCFAVAIWAYLLIPLIIVIYFYLR